MISATRLILTAGLIGFAILALGLVWTLRAPTLPALSTLSAETLDPDQSPNWYAALFAEAAASDRWALARAAARLETQHAPQQSAAWHRLTLAATQVAGMPDREALRALLEAYRVAPYTAPQDMVWRVEFAAQYWPTMPDIIADHTLTQVTVLGQIGAAQGKRFQWCERFPTGGLKTAVCDTLTAPA